MAIAFDPGIGFGKALEHNLDVARAALNELRVHDRPLVIGVSRKSFLAKLIDSPDDRDRLGTGGGADFAPAGARRGRCFRVHDVKENVSALRVTEAILRRTRMIHPTHRSLVQRAGAAPVEIIFAERGDLLRLSLFSRNAWRERS